MVEITTTLICETIESLERHMDFDMPHWMEDDIHWWPLYRLEIKRALFNQHTKPSGGARSGVLIAYLSAMMKFAEYPQRRNSVWLLSDGAIYDSYQGVEIDRLCAPIAMWCERNNIAASVMDRESLRRPTLSANDCWCAPMILRAKLMSAVSSILSTDQRHKKIVWYIRQVARAHNVPIPGLAVRELSAKARAIKFIASALESQLERRTPTAIFMVNYASVSGMGYALAASRADIASVDIQHGVQGMHHMAYSRWPVKRLKSTSLLPKWFMTWNIADSEIINQWACESANSRHRAVCSGNPYFDAWRDGIFVADECMKGAVASLISRAGTSFRVLVTLQPRLMDENALEPLLYTMQRVTGVRWWIRLHPLAKDSRQTVEALLGEKRISNWEIEVPTDLPLPVLLSNVYLHVTHSSSTYLEAQAMGVHTVIWSQYGVKLASDAIERGICHPKLSGSEFLAYLNGEITKPKSHGVHQDASPGCNLDVALGAILDEAQGLSNIKLRTIKC